MKILKLDYDAAERYLTLLNGNKPIDNIKFQFTFFDDKKGGMKGYKYGTLKNAWPMITSKNNSGCGIFVTVNRTDKAAINGKSKNDDITGIRAVFRDIDMPPPKDPELKPTFTVMTSEKKWHDYWIVEDGNVNFEDWNKVMSTMVNDYGADRGAKDLARVLRLPGTYHIKNDPVLVTLEIGQRDKLYTWKDINNAFTPKTSKKINKNSSNKISNVNINYPPLLLEEYEEILSIIPCVDLDEKEWWEVATSIRQYSSKLNTTNERRVFENWDRWCMTGNNYDKEKNYKTWEYVKDKYSEITEGTLIWFAKKYGWSPSKDRVLIERYIYSQDGSGSYYDTNTGTIIRKDVFNDTNLREFPGGKNTPKANFVYQSHENKRIVQGYGWLPLPYKRAKELIFEHNGKRYINEWNGFAIDPIEGDISLWMELVEFLIRDKAERDILLDWMAFTVQHPDKKINFQILHMGNEGVGKDVMYSPLSIICGEYAEDIDHEKAVNQFEDSWAKKKFVTIQEIYRPGDKGFLNAIKIMAASTSTGMIRLNRKYLPQILQPNVVSFVAMSNHEDCMALTASARRYFVIKSFFQPKKDFNYDYLADKWMREENGASKIFQFLLNRDVSKFNHGKLPFRTTAFFELVKSSRPDYEIILEEWSETNYKLFGNDLICASGVRKLLMNEFRKNISVQSISKALVKLGWISLVKRGQKKIEGKVDHTPYLYSKSPSLFNEKTPKVLWEIWKKTPKEDNYF